MAERITLEIEVLEPEDGDDQWEARLGGFSGYGESATAALGALGSEIDVIFEDSEYNRVHAPGIYGQSPDRQVPEVLNLDDRTIQEGDRRREPDSLHSSDQSEDRLQPGGRPAVATRKKAE